MRQTIKKIPIIGKIAQRIYRNWNSPPQPFTDSNSYWVDRYEAGGDSGDGSYNKLAEFKAEILNKFVMQEKIETVIEYGCGDGNQLKLAKYPSYTGFDVSNKALSMCKEVFLSDNKKTFKPLNEYNGETAELVLSLDVIFHLVEDSVFRDHMNKLFDSSKKFVIIYSSDTQDNPEGQSPHVRHREVSKWIERNKPEWQLLSHITNIYPFDGDTKTGSFADFFIYQLGRFS